MTQPLDHFGTAPSAVVRAWRFPSRSPPGRTYDAALARDGTWSCECWPFLKLDACAHIEAAIVLLANERRSEDRQAELDARLGCRHLLTFDEDEPDFAEQRTHVWRTCLGCNLVVDRAPWQERIEADIRERRRLPPSPWTASERASDPS